MTPLPYIITKYFVQNFKHAKHFFDEKETRVAAASSVEQLSALIKGTGTT